MNSSTSRREERGGCLTSGSRFILFVLAVVFVAGALTQFFLAGMAVFDTPDFWLRHETVGHIIGEVAFVMWIPAVVGRSGARIIIGSLLMAILFMAQYAFINAGQPYVQALHPLNGALLFALSLWLALQTLQLIWATRARPAAVAGGDRKREDGAS